MKCANCARYEARIEELEENLALVKYELAQYKKKMFKRKKGGKDDKDNDAGNTPPPKKKGGLFGHIGWFRKKPKKYDRIKDVKLDRCPKCRGKNIHEYEEPEEHVQEDIIIPQKETVLFRKHVYYYRDCKEAVTGRGINELPNSYIGHMAKALAVFLKFQFYC